MKPATGDGTFVIRFTDDATTCERIRNDLCHYCLDRTFDGLEAGLRQLNRT